MCLHMVKCENGMNLKLHEQILEAELHIALKKMLLMLQGHRFKNKSGKLHQSAQHFIYHYAGSNDFCSRICLIPI